ncbi:MAG: prolyl oligopeptidase family serine peptidase, partial [Porticoccaceae bacterium]|nr:prolyl oligopeptidase family serine peptidase [Porticoccaceae bacterium]MDP4890458.1 prolyl oligopeptidase family serine peptidase [Porticoccaceae bacterium]
VESADISALSENWQWPEPVKLMAADGKTDIYGLLFRPSDFSPDKRYPVINFINSGPWLSVVPKGSFHTSRGYAERHYFYSAAMAELGFIVLNLDSRGSPLRSKAFLDESYGWIPASANTDDHAGAIQQLAQRYPYMDINRVGICTQLYGSGLQNFLERQDLYKVCVQMSLLDNRLIGCTIEGDKWEGINGPSTDKYHYPEVLVNQLKGKLMLMQSITSPVSTAYPSTATFRVVEALQKANKAFEMLMIPGSPSGSPCSGYMTRRGWDFLVKHLLKATPPTAFELIDMKMSSADK